jgi:hypothetical protein
VRLCRRNPPVAAEARSKRRGPASRWGAIQDRTRDHLGQSDEEISAYRASCALPLTRPARAASKPLMVLDPGSRREDDRTGGDRRHRPDRRLAGLLAEDRCSAPQGVELGERG